VERLVLCTVPRQHHGPAPVRVHVVDPTPPVGVVVEVAIKFGQFLFCEVEAVVGEIPVPDHTTLTLQVRPNREPRRTLEEIIQVTVDCPIVCPRDEDPVRAHLHRSELMLVLQQSVGPIEGGAIPVLQTRMNLDLHPHSLFTSLD